MIATTESGRIARRTSRRTVAANSTNERRQRARLRELCDEVLASYRVARGQDLFSESERAEARQLLATMFGKTA